MKRLVVCCFVLISVAIILYNCNQKETNPFLNVQENKAHYVGMQTCRSCHWQIYETFIKTGMGQSWDNATKQKSAADFSPTHSIVFDTFLNMYYKPFWVGDSMYVMEYRLQDNDTVHKRIEKISYIVGSGQHTNSHIINTNGYLHQAPITYYTQKKKWDLAPGFEKGMNTRFDRKIEMECISCHTGYPEFIENSLNKYNKVALGIDCERCHGPGSLHVSEKQKGNIVDTSLTPDYTIVNPRRLSTELQNDLCQRCHLQGITVLNDGKSFFDFKPSEKLNKTMNTFMPHYTGSENHMIMASHVERMKMSACFIKSGKMSCITCHNPHISVKFTPQTHFNSACKNCHTEKNISSEQSRTNCTEKVEIRNTKQDNCVTCHMPQNGSIDIPHVAVTDHYIRKKTIVSNEKEIIQFANMICYNNDKPSYKTRARAFIEFYERYQPSNLFLDSALFYLKKSGVNSNKDVDDDLIRIYFLQKKYKEIIALVKNKKADYFKDGWTCYRIGESFLKEKNPLKAIEFLKESVNIKKYALDFQNKLGDAFLEANQHEQAKKVYDFVISENTRNTEALSGLGYIAMQENKNTIAKKYFLQSLSLNPDQIQTLINLAVTYHQSNEKKLIKPVLQHALTIAPENKQIIAMLADLEK